MKIIKLDDLFVSDYNISLDQVVLNPHEAMAKYFTSIEVTALMQCTGNKYTVFDAAGGDREDPRKMFRVKLFNAMIELKKTCYFVADYARDVIAVSSNTKKRYHNGKVAESDFQNASINLNKHKKILDACLLLEEFIENEVKGNIPNPEALDVISQRIFDANLSMSKMILENDISTKLAPAILTYDAKEYTPTKEVGSRKHGRIENFRMIYDKDLVEEYSNKEGQSC